MKKLVIILLFLSISIFAKYNQMLSGKLYLETFATFWKNTCKDYVLNSKDKTFRNIEKDFDIDICTYVYGYAKMKYMRVVLNCYKDGKSINQCISENNALVEALKMK